MTDALQSQLDQVLALLDKATKGELIYRHGENVQIKHPNGETYNFARLHCTIGKSEREWENGDAIVASINFLREHGPAIRGAVGGEAVAWRARDVGGTGVHGLWHDYVANDSRNDSHLSALIGEGVAIEYAYASPPATVDVVALRGILAVVMQSQQQCDEDGQMIAVSRQALDELAALIGEKA